MGRGGCHWHRHTCMPRTRCPKCAACQPTLTSWGRLTSSKSEPDPDPGHSLDTRAQHTLPKADHNFGTHAQYTLPKARDMPAGHLTRQPHDVHGLYTLDTLPTVDVTGMLRRRKVCGRPTGSALMARPREHEYI